MTRETTETSWFLTAKTFPQHASISSKGYFTDKEWYYICSLIQEPKSAPRLVRTVGHTYKVFMFDTLAEKIVDITFLIHKLTHIRLSEKDLTVVDLGGFKSPQPHEMERFNHQLSVAPGDQYSTYLSVYLDIAKVLTPSCVWETGNEWYEKGDHRDLHGVK